MPAKGGRGRPKLLFDRAREKVRKVVFGPSSGV